MHLDRVSIRLIRLSLVIIFIGFIIFVTSFILFQNGRVYDLNAPIDSQLLSHLGDVIGGLVGAIWGLAGVLLFYVALRSQSEQLKLQMEEIGMQREELKLTRIELERTASAQEKSEKALHEQSEILKKTLTYQAFQSFTTEYAQPVMSQCVKDLWDFKRKYKNETESAYIDQFDKDYDDKEAAEFSTIEESFTIHNKRRLVTQFYHRVQSFIDQEIFPKEIFYIYWSRPDLEIIPQVLVPMEIALGKIIKGEDYQMDMSNSSIMRLYKNSPLISE